MRQFDTGIVKRLPWKVCADAKRNREFGVLGLRMIELARSNSLWNESESTFLPVIIGNSIAELVQRLIEERRQRNVEMAQCTAAWDAYVEEIYALNSSTLVEAIRDDEDDDDSAEEDDDDADASNDEADDAPPIQLAASVLSIGVGCAFRGWDITYFWDASHIHHCRLHLLRSLLVLLVC